MFSRRHHLTAEVQQKMRRRREEGGGGRGRRIVQASPSAGMASLSAGQPLPPRAHWVGAGRTPLGAAYFPANTGSSFSSVFLPLPAPVPPLPTFPLFLFSLCHFVRFSCSSLIIDASNDFGTVLDLRSVCLQLLHSVNL